MGIRDQKSDRRGPVAGAVLSLERGKPGQVDRLQSQRDPIINGVLVAVGTRGHGERLLSDLAHDPAFNFFHAIGGTPNRCTDRGLDVIRRCEALGVVNVVDARNVADAIF
jgi:hypothetical protein